MLPGCPECCSECQNVLPTIKTAKMATGMKIVLQQFEKFLCYSHKKKNVVYRVLCVVVHKFTIFEIAVFLLSFSLIKSQNIFTVLYLT